MARVIIAFISYRIVYLSYLDNGSWSRLAAAAKETIVSPSLIKEFDPSRSIPAELRIGWEELMGVPINPANYIRLSTLELGNVEPTNHDKLDLAKNSDKSTSASSCTVLGEVLASEYEYIDEYIDPNVNSMWLFLVCRLLVFSYEVCNY